MLSSCHLLSFWSISFVFVVIAMVAKVFDSPFNKFSAAVCVVCLVLARPVCVCLLVYPPARLYVLYTRMTPSNFSCQSNVLLCRHYYLHSHSTVVPIFSWKILILEKENKMSIDILLFSVVFFFSIFVRLCALSSYCLYFQLQLNGNVISQNKGICKLWNAEYYNLPARCNTMNE